MFTKQQYYQAIELALRHHKGQYRKGTEDPYIIHPMHVALIVTTVKKSKNRFLLGAACFLHDVPEDTNMKLDDIALVFGHQLASIVEELTNDEKELERLGKALYLGIKMVGMSSYALVIKLADRYCNLLDLGDLPTDKQQAKITETKHIINMVKEDRPKLTGTHHKLITMIEHLINP